MDMNDKKQPTVGRALMPLIIIPITLIIDIALIAVGFGIDGAIYNPPPSTPSFMVPAFTIICMLIAAGISIIALIVMIILIVSGLSKVKKSRSQSDEISGSP